MLNLDFSNVPSREPLDEGTYTLVISEAELKESSTHNPMLSIVFDVQGVDGDRKLWENFTLIDKCLWKVKEFFNALGIDVNNLVDMDENELIGLSCNAKVIQEPYQGDIKNSVKKYYPVA